MNLYKKCVLCPRKCMINRYINKGFCNLNNEIKVENEDKFSLGGKSLWI